MTTVRSRKGNTAAFEMQVGVHCYLLLSWM